MCCRACQGGWTTQHCLSWASGFMLKITDGWSRCYWPDTLRSISTNWMRQLQCRHACAFEWVLRHLMYAAAIYYRPFEAGRKWLCQHFLPWEQCTLFSPVKLSCASEVPLILFCCTHLWDYSVLSVCFLLFFFLFCARHPSLWGQHETGVGCTE